MIKKRYALIFSLFVSMYTLAQVKNQPKEVFETPDKPAQFPGGNEALQQYIAKRLLTTNETKIRGKTGRAMVEFVVGTDGFVRSESVKLLKGIDKDFDKAAINVVSDCKVQWEPASRGSRPIKQRFVIPIQFESGMEPLIRSYIKQETDISFRTIVNEKPGTPKIRDWQLYSDVGMTKRGGYLSPGDTVEVIGIGAWSFGIRRDYKVGYISWKALEITSEMEFLVRKIEENSPKIEKELMRVDSLKQVEERSKMLQALKNSEDSKHKIAPDNRSAFLSLTAAKNEVMVNECVVITLALNVSTKNGMALQFFELSSQLGAIINSSLRKDYCWNSNNMINTVEGDSVELKDGYYVTYPIYNGSYCPVNAKPINLPSVTLQLVQYKGQRLDEKELVAFTSSPLAISVVALPENVKATKSDYYSMVGSFSVTDSLNSATIVAGKPVQYSIKVQGKGNTFPISPPVLEWPSGLATFIESEFSDTIINGAYHSSNTFFYSLVFNKPGIYDLTDKIIFHSYASETKGTQKLSLQRSFIVDESIVVDTDIKSKSWFYKNNLILFDASQSMMIEDYLPHRLGAVKKGLIKFLSTRSTCDIGLILFGGDAKQYPLQTVRECYSTELLDAIDFRMVPQGTAIGNALWTAIKSTMNGGSDKKIVIIGDGDNTAGNIPVGLAIEIAKKYDVKVYSIGVGNTGVVQFGKDYFGRPNMVDDTFFDGDLKKLATGTSGKYYWAKDADAISSILKEIFK